MKKEIFVTESAQLTTENEKSFPRMAPRWAFPRY